MQTMMITDKASFLEAFRASTEKDERETLEIKTKVAKKLQDALADVGIGSVIQDSVHVIVANEYELYEGYDRFYSPCYMLKALSSGKKVRVGYSLSRIDERFIVQLGEAMVELDKPEPEVVEPIFAYSFKGDSLGEILQNVLEHIAYEAYQQA